MEIDKTPSSILEAFELIVEAARNSGLDEDFFSENRVAIGYAGTRLNLKPEQTVFLALFVDNSEECAISLSKLAEYAGCRTTRILRLAHAIEELEKRRYVRVTRGRSTSISYRVPKEVLKALTEDSPYVYKTDPVVDLNTFFDHFKKLMEEKDNAELSHDALLNQTVALLEQIRESSLSRGIRRYRLDGEDTLLLAYMAHLFVENSDDNILFSDIENIFDDEEIPSWLKRELRCRNSSLMACGLIENVNEDGMARSDAFKLTDKAKEEVLADLNLKDAGRSDKGLLGYESISPKRLFYNATEKSQIEELEALLSKRRFAEIQESLRKAGMRPGFCCLFYGSPGTGKTETVYQLARRTRRNIMQVDVDKIKSCWVGESEKNVKALFDRYRSICRSSGNAPILLFNEADAVLGVRMEGASRAVDKMENSLQNIILQEMENLEGIMIATTNLTTNLDKAFERRFLYKIKYDRPSVEARARIWQTMLKGVGRKAATELATRFDLAGGEIENVVRKHTVNAIITNNRTVDLDRISELCLAERLRSREMPRVGF